MKKIIINSYAKINLSLDVKAKREDGYHEIESVMQQLELHDVVCVKWDEEYEEGYIIELSTNRHYLPNDERNLAYRAAKLMLDKYAKDIKYARNKHEEDKLNKASRSDKFNKIDNTVDMSFDEQKVADSKESKGGKIRIDIKKEIPVAAGLAGGSSNAAAVMHALNRLWGLSLSLSELCNAGQELGADVPFCLMGQARANKNLGGKICKDPLATSCALATGIGTSLMPITALYSFVVLSKPPISVSTKEVYEGIDAEITHAKDAGIKVKRPDAYDLLTGLKERNLRKVKDNMINVLEYYTLKKYPVVVNTKVALSEKSMPHKVLMSGSGPTVFAIYPTKARAKQGYSALKNENIETFLTKTTD